MVSSSLSKMGRPPKATQDQIKGMSDALALIEKNSHEYRQMRRSFAVAIGCTERAIEMMLARFEKGNQQKTNGEKQK